MKPHVTIRIVSRRWVSRRMVLLVSAATVSIVAITSGNVIANQPEIANDRGACPGAPPTSGSPCAISSTCTWGTHPASICRTRAACILNVWRVTDPPAFCTANPSGCPEKAPSGQCASAGTKCAYKTGTTCECAICCSAPGCEFPCGDNRQGTPLWKCTPGPELRPPCPTFLPNDGARCSLPAGTNCLTSSCGLNVTCDGHFWRWRLRAETCQPRRLGPGKVPGVCAAADTPIATPDGERPIFALKVGDLVYSIDQGTVRAVPVIRAEHVAVHDHHVMRVQLRNGRVIRISPGHPTATGVDIATVKPGDLLGGESVATIELVPYRDSATYDILPLSDTATYFAAGVPLSSTLGAPASTFSHQSIGARWPSCEDDRRGGGEQRSPPQVGRPARSTP
jgi:hypothetical protein